MFTVSTILVNTPESLGWVYRLSGVSGGVVHDLNGHTNPIQRCEVRVDRVSFGELLRARRLAQPSPTNPDDPLSIRGLAQRVHVTHTMIFHLESGTRAVSQQLAERLDEALHANREITTAYAALREPSEHWPQAVPRQLPPQQHPLVGRDDEIATVQHRIAAETDRTCTTPPVLILTGPGGVGKTALGVAVAHQLAEGMPSLFADLRGWDDELDPKPLDGVLRNWCRSLNTAAQALGGDLDELIGVWRTTSEQQRLVILIDNARREQVCPLIPASGSSLVVVTTRDRLTDVTGAIQHEVRPLNDTHAAELLAVQSGMSTEALAPLIPRCGGLPLALQVAGLDARQHETEETIMQMARAYAELDELSPIDRATRRSYAELDDDVQQAWRLCALTSGTPSLGQAAAMIGRSQPVSRRLLNGAADACLLNSVGGGWRYHDLHLAFARRESRRMDSAEERDAAVYRGLTWILHGSARAAIHIAGRDDTPLNLVPCPDDVEPPVIANYVEGMAWTDAHWHNDPAPIHAALERGWTRLAWQLVAVALNYVFIAKPLSSWDRAARDALIAAEQANDTEGIAWMHQARGLVAGDRGDFDRAVGHLLTALHHRRDLGHVRDIGWSAINAARFAFAAGATDDEITPLIDEAVEAHESIRFPAGVVLGKAFYGGLHARRGDWDTAAAFLQEAFDQAPEVGDPAITSYIGTALADAQLHLDRPDEAAETARTADEHARDHDADWYRIAALSTLADCVTSDEARHHLRLAVSIADSLSDPREAELRQRLDQLPG
ncbi:AAA family ATPase [Allosaccharopolyspora coralli]|uniref:AAA family ATPase n=1 Tax=Allosaccharopolyspora coralli TaxID=2665642 RepID=UPI00165289D9|nr:AAA family ATPase [Allosaccharopolyspora coralli]